MAAVHYTSPRGKHNDRSKAKEQNMYSAEVEPVHGADEQAQMNTD